MQPATWAGCGAILLWAGLALLSRGAAALPPLQLTAMGFAVSAVAGLGWLAGTGQLAVLRQPPLAWLHGVGGLFGFHALYFASLRLAPPAEANLINYTWPLLIVLLSAAVLGLRLSWHHLAGAGLGLLGCVVLLGAGVAFQGQALLGYALAAGSAATWALYSVLARRLAAVPSQAVIGFCAGTALLAAAAHWLTETTVVPSASEWAAAIALGLGPVGAAFLLWDVGMKRGDPRLLGTLAFATPVLSTLLLAVAGYTPFGPRLFGAALLIAAGGLVAARLR